MQELVDKRKMEEYREKLERENKIKEKEEEIELEKVRKCQQALEREKISKGMRCTREDEIALRKMQLMQVQERQMIQSEERERDKMWHQVLVNTVKNKELQEIMESQRRHEEMMSRRKAYDEQIASANRKRQEMMRIERERENILIEEIQGKMETDREKELKRRKEQQLLNSKNYIGGHELKLSRLLQERQTERQIDNYTVQTALEELRKERQRDLINMKKLQQEKQVFIEHYNRERKSAIRMSEESDQAARAWQEVLDNKADEHLRSIEERKAMDKVKQASAYKTYLEELNQNCQRERENRARRTERVRKVATSELGLQMRKACEELDRQVEYRKNLDEQIEQNQRVLNLEMQQTEECQRPFTERPKMFREAMRHIERAPGRNSTNPVHPFRRLLEMNGSSCSVLK